MGATDCNAIASSIMNSHDQNCDAQYHTDADGDRVGSSLDNCLITSNPNQDNLDGVGDLYIFTSSLFLSPNFSRINTILCIPIVDG